MEVRQAPVRDHGELLSLIERQQPRPELRLGEILTGDFGVEECDLQVALRRQRKHCGKHLGAILREMGVVDDELLNAALGRKFGIPYVRLEALEISAAVLARIPVEVAFQYSLMPLSEHRDRLIVAMANPLDTESLDALRFNCPLKIVPVMASFRDITLAHNKYYSKFDEDEALEDSARSGMSRSHENGDPSQHLEQQARTRPIVRLLNAIVLQGVLRKASDINIRPGPREVAIFYRIDGRMQYSRSLDKTLLAALVSRVKIIAHLDIAERRLPQGGNARLMRAEHPIDLRISILPTIHGESVVIRILDKQAGLKSLAELGMGRRDEARVRALLGRPSGILLVTGQTGSGKTTTLYAMLQELTGDRPHIITIEDPVEYDIEGVEQIQIHEKKGLTFPTILRHILRHDPDIIMVGEIRDQETARIASRAALTGHLVLSTLHTNDAPSAITRLLDLGVAPYILGATLLGVMSQRLVRLICPRCRTPGGWPPAGRDDGRPSFHGKGCSHCNYTGYRGRILVSEILPASPELAQAIHRAATTHEIAELAQLQGMRRIQDKVMALVEKGKVSWRDGQCAEDAS